MKRKIVLIDDDERFMDMFSRYLERTGIFEVFKLLPRDDLLKQVRSIQPDLILLDILMPHRTGSEMLDDFHDDDEHLLRVIFLTGIISSEQVNNNILEIGPCKYLSKGLPVERMIELINQEVSC